MNGTFGSSKYGTDLTAPTRERGATAAAIDNLIRRKLRISDPSNAHEVAEALGKLYVSEREAMTREAAGLPFVTLPAPPAAPVPTTSSSAEVDQATTDVERDLMSLSTNSLLKDIEPELKGWGYAIRNAVGDGISAARFSLDPRQRERAFGSRRLLGDYARIARFVGALTPTLNLPYRRLAQSLDEVAAVILVLMGEALANIGFSGGRFLLQVPASELQARRDAVLYALRNLIGSAQEAYGPNDWPRGLVAYRQFMDRLESSGHADLKALFQENHLSRLMDELIDRAASTNVEGLRALGSTAQLGVERFRRLILVGQRVVTPEAPPLAAFLSALQLFVDPFDEKNFSRGSRLLFISRPPIVFYGLYGVAGPDEGTQRLLNLTSRRGRLADLLDCYLACECSDARVRCQILLDKILYDLDRAIDLYALGTDPEGDGEPERRAAAYGFIADELLRRADEYCCFRGAEPCGPQPSPPKEDILRRAVEDVRDELWYRNDFSVPDQVRDNFGNDYAVSGFSRVGFDDLGRRVRIVEEEIAAIEGGTTNPISSPLTSPVSGIEVTVPEELQTLRELIDMMHQELCIQYAAEQQWENLLHTMAPSCVRFNGVLDPTRDLLRDALRRINADPCPAPTVNIPPHFETSLDSIADDVDRTGLGRPSK
jgi:hypothetical protein